MRKKEVKDAEYSFRISLVNGSNTWVLTIQDNNRIGTSQIRFLRLMLGIMLKDKMRSDNVWERLQTKSTVGKVHQYQRKWTEHKCFSWQTCFYDPLWRQDIGQPRKK